MTEKNIQRILLLAFCFSGAAALAYEVVWTRALSFTFGSTVYALSTILATFMAGLALGAYIGGKLADRKDNLLFYFGVFELGIGLFGFFVVQLIYNLPPFYYFLYQKIHLNPTLFYSAQFFISAAVMIIPTTLMGATFPVVSKRLTNNMSEMGRKVGDAYSANTFGAILGSILAGFVLVPSLGLKWASFTSGTVNILTGMIIIILSKKSLSKAVITIVTISILVGAIFVSQTDLKHPKTTFYQVMRYEDFNSLKEEERSSEIIFKKNYPEGQIIVYRGEHDFLELQQNGKLEGTSSADIPNTIRLATVPAAVFSGVPEDMFVIGLGAGVTTWAANKVANNVEVAEINPGVVEAVRRFGFPDSLEKVTVHVTDARNYLYYTDKKYSIITSEPSVPSESMAGNLFTREFYEIAASRLKKEGVMCQWLPAWLLETHDARSAIKTFASVFNHVYLWRVMRSNDYIMLGSKTPIQFSPEEVDARSLALARMVVPSSWVEEMQLVGVDFAKLFEMDIIRDDQGIREILAMDNVPVFTDDKPRLEFIITRNLLRGGA